MRPVLLSDTVHTDSFTAHNKFSQDRTLETSNILTVGANIM